MTRPSKIGVVSLLLSLAVLGFGIDVTPAVAARSQGAVTESAADKSVDPAHSGSASNSLEQEEKGLSQKAEEIGRVGNFPITNSMVVSWIVALTLIIFIQFATRNMKPVPDGAQNLLEWLVEGLYKFIVGTIGWGHETAHGFKIDQPLFRGANADVNMTLAMALVFFGLWLFWSFSEVGLRGFLKELFGPKGETPGFLKWPMLLIFFAAGCLEIISILVRPVALTFRLYGNIFAGENVLDTMSKLIPGLGWLLPIPFYFLELLMGLVQAMVFMLLTAVFTFLMCHREEETAAGHD